MRHALGLTSLLLAGLLAMGCAPLKPWERGKLMQRCMQPALDPLEVAMDARVHHTRESAQGASAGGGPSCGCN